MSSPKYGVRKAEPRNLLPEIDLLPVIECRGNKLDVAVFGPSTYRNNVESMEGQYYHSEELPNISFRPATISESISIASHGFGSKEEVDAKRDIFNPRWLQAGYIVKTQDGVYTNTSLTDNTKLKSLLNKAEKVNGIYLLNNGIAFAPRESFETGVQGVDDFVLNPKINGLARALEHTPEKTAENLGRIASTKLYKKGVNVFGFDAVKEPVHRVASLNSDRDIHGGRLDVNGDGWNDNNLGYAFGVSNKSRSDASKN